MEKNISAGFFLSGGMSPQDLEAPLSPCGVTPTLSQHIHGKTDFLKELSASALSELRLVILDLTGQADPLFLAREIADRCSPGTAILAMGPANDVELYRNLLGVGVSDYLVTPVPSPLLLQAVEKLLGKGKRNDGSCIVAFYAAHAGSGTGLLTAGTAAWISGLHGRDTLCADADLASSSIGSHMGIDKPGNLSILLQAGERLDSSLVQQASRAVTDNLSMLNAFDPMRDAALDEGATSAALLGLLRRQHRFQLWRVAGAGALQREIMSTADMVYVVVTGTLASAAAAQSVLRWLEQNNSRAVTSQIFNAVAPRQELTPAMLSQVTGKENKLVIPYKKSLCGDLSTNVPLKERKHAMFPAFAELGEDILGIRSEKRKGLRGRFGL